MSTKRCFRCGAHLNFTNCEPPFNPCPDCGQCECLRDNYFIELTKEEGE